MHVDTCLRSLFSSLALALALDFDLDLDLALALEARPTTQLLLALLAIVIDEHYRQLPLLLKKRRLQEEAKEQEQEDQGKEEEAKEEEDQAKEEEEHIGFVFLRKIMLLFGDHEDLLEGMREKSDVVRLLGLFRVGRGLALLRDDRVINVFLDKRFLQLLRERGHRLMGKMEKRTRTCTGNDEDEDEHAAEAILHPHQTTYADTGTRHKRLCSGHHGVVVIDLTIDE